MLSAPSGQRGLSLNSATGNPRNKVALAPGHSLVDWIRLGKSGKDLTGVGGELRDVTEEELARHCTVDDAWTAIKGNVYNITFYNDFHPGGIPELMRGAGIDCTALFEEVHKWVNYESMLSKCLVGRLVPKITGSSIPALRKGPRASLLGSLTALQPPAPADTNGTAPTNGHIAKKEVEIMEIPVVMSIPRYDWFQSDSSVTVTIYTRCPRVQSQSVIVESNNRQFHIRVFVDDHTYHVNRELETDVTPEYKVVVGSSNGKVEVILPKTETGRHWSSLGQLGQHDSLWKKTADEDVSYWSCRIISIDSVTHDTNLYGLEFPHGSFMSVPVGRHVFVTASIADMNIVHSYTIIPPSLLGNHSLELKVRDGRALCMMIKIYEDGVMTPLIGRLRLGDCLQVSSTYAGNFNVSCLSEVSQLILYAAGTGFTPMAAILAHCYNEAQATHVGKRSVQLLFFNKSENDILWRHQLDQLAAAVEWFKVNHVLSEPSDSWCGLKGFFSEKLFTPYVPLPDSQSSRLLLCVCGPTPFSTQVVRLAKQCNYSDNMIHVFAG